MAHDACLHDSQRFRQVVNPDSCGLHVQTVFRNARIANPRQIRRDDREFLSLIARNQWRPHSRRFRVPVQKDDCRPMTGRQIVKVDTVHFLRTAATRSRRWLSGFVRRLENRRQTAPRGEQQSFPNLTTILIVVSPRRCSNTGSDGTESQERNPRDRGYDSRFAPCSRFKASTTARNSRNLLYKFSHGRTTRDSTFR